MTRPPILADKHPEAPSVFEPDALLREARRQRGLAAARPCPAWACYHTELDRFHLDGRHGGREVGIVGRAVGASFALPVAEQLFTSGCRLLVSLTSAGQIVPAGAPPCFVVIDRAWRDEGTSNHDLPPSD